MLGIFEMAGKAFVSSLIALGLAGVASAHAEDVDLGEIVVTAGLLPIEEEQIGRAYTVVTSEELESRQIQYVSDALRTVPGLSVSRNGSYGSLTTVRIRGAESKHTLVLIDGVEVSSISHGAYDFSTLEASGIERIEVLRGPQSSLYGANAMAGVVNIITKRGERSEKPTITVKTEVGSELSSNTSVSLSGGEDRFDYAFSGAFHHTDGINISQNGSEKDANRNVTLNGKINADLTDTLSVDSSVRFVDKQSDADVFNVILTDDTIAYSNTREFFASLGLTHSLWDDRFVQKARVKYSSSESRGLDYQSWTSTYADYGSNSDRLSLNYQGTVFFDTPSVADAKHSLTGALEWQHETYSDPFTTDPTRKRKSYAYVAEYKGEFWDRLFLSAGLRYDNYEDFDNSLTYNASAAYLIDSTGTRLHSSVGTGTSNPTYYEVYNTFFGNPSLTPESNFGWDVGIEQSLFDDRFKVDLTYFNQRLKDEIVWSSVTWRYSNETGISKRQGIEVSASAELTDTLFVDASYTYTDSKTPTGTQEARRPEHAGSIKINKSFLDGELNTFVDASFSVDMVDTATALDDYALVNVGADYQLTDSLQIFGRVENLFDADYEEIDGYNTAGITAYLGMKATF